MDRSPLNSNLQGFFCILSTQQILFGVWFELVRGPTMVSSDQSPQNDKNCSVNGFYFRFAALQAKISICTWFKRLASESHSSSDKNHYKTSNFSSKQKVLPMNKGTFITKAHSYTSWKQNRKIAQGNNCCEHMRWPFRIPFTGLLLSRISCQLSKTCLQHCEIQKYAVWNFSEKCTLNVCPLQFVCKSTVVVSMHVRVFCLFFFFILLGNVSLRVHKFTMEL